MSRRTRPRIPPKELRELWEEIPAMKNCKGKCDVSCGPIGCSRTERKLVEERAGKDLTVVGGTQVCTMLRDGRCTVYSIRPTLCRLWGTIPSMRCPYGCEPERWLTDREGYKILARSMDEDDPDGMTAAQDLLDRLGPEGMRAFTDYVRAGDDLRPVIEKGGMNEELFERAAGMAMPQIAQRPSGRQRQEKP